MAEIHPLILDEETLKDLWLMYKGAFARMTDAERSHDVFIHQVMHENSQFFHVGKGAVLYLTQMNQLPRAAVFHVLLKEDWEKDSLGRGAVREVMDMFALVRLTTFVPTVQKEAGQLMEYFGFTPEGVFRKYLEYNGELSNITFYGLLREDLDVTQSKASELLKRAGVT